MRKIKKKLDLGTSEGLYELARQAGLQKDADRILEKHAGEKPKEIFSGGFISDIFDGLNALQYGVTGVLKGKTFLEGVKTRQSFSDKDALGDLGLPGVITGVALDIATDPLTYIAPATVLRKVPGLVKVAQAVKKFAFGDMVSKTIKVGETLKDGSKADVEKTFEQLEGGTKLGKYLADKFVYQFGVDKVYKKIAEDVPRNIGVTTELVGNMVRGLGDLSQETAAKLLTKDELGRFKRTKLEDLAGISPEEFGVVTKVYQKIDELGKQAVDLGILTKEKYEENVGEYIKNAYLEYEKFTKKSLLSKASKGIKGVKTRVTDEEFVKSYLKSLGPDEVKKLYPDIVSDNGNILVKSFQETNPEEFKQIAKKGFEQMALAKGQIDNPAYLMFKTAIDLVRDVENGKLFRATSEKFASNVAQDGYKLLPTSQRLGDLSGKYVPENIFNQIQEISEPFKDSWGKKLIAEFKYNKVILNPGTHVRNTLSNIVLNWWKLGLGPWRADIYGQAVKEFYKGGEYLDRAKAVGLNTDTFIGNETKSLLDDPAVREFGKKVGGWRTVQKKVADVYQGEENVAKMAAFIHGIKKGMTDEAAWKAAESATFNYAKVTPFIRKMRTSLFGVPFITFTAKSTPVAIETILKHPRRVSVFGKARQGIENLSDTKETEREKSGEAPWIKDGFYVKLPMKDKYGRSAYFDLTYIIPFGDLVSGGLFQRGVQRETGTAESVPSALTSASPVLNLVKELSRNQDFFGDRIWNESGTTDEQIKDITRHLTKTFMPPLIADQIPGGWNKNGERNQRGAIKAITKDQKDTQNRTVMQELLANVGAKVQPIDADIQDSYSEYNKVKALQTLLTEKEIIQMFSKGFQPTEKKKLKGSLK